MRDRGSYDQFEATWKDEDDNLFRATFDPDEPDTAVLRIWPAGEGNYWNYVTLDRQDREDLIKLLGGEVK